MENKFKRMYDLKSLLSSTAINNSIFHEFESSCEANPEKLTSFLAWENELLLLEEPCWEELKLEAKLRVKFHPNGRGYEQFFSILNQARAYNFIKNDLGCSVVSFIKRTHQKSPDIQACLNQEKILCEVKTINPSDEEIDNRQTLKNVGFIARSTQPYLDDGFYKRLKSALNKAVTQINTYNKEGIVRKIVFIVINFDDFFSEYKESFYSQIDEYIISNPIHDIEIVFYNQKTTFHKNIIMKSAYVINQN